MGSLEKPDDSTYGVYIHIVTYILFIYHSYHIYIYTLFLSWCILFFLADLKSPYQTYVKKPTNNVERRNPTVIFWNRWIDSVGGIGGIGFREPCLHQKRLQKVGKPEAFRISIHHGEQSRLHWHHHSWCDGSLWNLTNQKISPFFFKQKTVKLYGNTLPFNVMEKVVCCVASCGFSFVTTSWPSLQARPWWWWAIYLLWVQVISEIQKNQGLQSLRWPKKYK